MFWCMRRALAIYALLSMGPTHAPTAARDVVVSTVGRMRRPDGIGFHSFRRYNIISMMV